MSKIITKEDIEIIYAMKTIKDKCEARPTCKGCKSMHDHIGCYFRGKSPREWDLGLILEDNKPNETEE